MTITFQKPSDAIHPEVCCEASLRCGVRSIVEAGQADLANLVSGQTLRSRALFLSQHFFTEVFPGLRARLDLPTPRPAYPCDVGHAALQRCRRTFQ